MTVRITEFEYYEASIDDSEIYVDFGEAGECAVDLSSHCIECTVDRVDISIDTIAEAVEMESMLCALQEVDSDEFNEALERLGYLNVDTPAEQPAEQLQAERVDLPPSEAISAILDSNYVATTMNKEVGRYPPKQ